MSSGLYSFGTSSFNAHSSSEMVSSDGDPLFFSDPFPFFTNDVSHHHNNSSNQNPFDEALPSSSSADPFSPAFFSFSPPSSNLENLNLQGNASYSAFDVSEVKNEECHVGFDYGYGQQFLPHSYSGAENLSKYMMQRSFSSNSFEGKPNNFLFQTMENSPNFQRHATSSPENGDFAGQMRRVCSTGDLQNMKANHTSQTEGSLLEEPNFKVGRYSAEERKERISKYRAKRSQRNFNKTIKYACRKTLADNRPRIRGRFARNDEPSEIPKAPCSTGRDEDEVDFWIEGLRLHEEQEDVVTVGAEHHVNGYGATQFQYCGF